MSGNNEKLRQSSRLKTRASSIPDFEESSLSPKNKKVGTPGRRGRKKRSNEFNVEDKLNLDSSQKSKGSEVTATPRRQTRSMAVTQKPDEEQSIDEAEPFRAFGKDLEHALDNISEDIQKPKTLFNDDNDVGGSQIYGFQTAIKKNAMVQKAMSSRASNLTKTSSSTLKLKRSLRLLLNRIDPTTYNLQSNRKRQDCRSSESESVSEDSEYVPTQSESEDSAELMTDDSDIENKDEGNVTPKKKAKCDVKEGQEPITPFRRGRGKNKIVYEDYHLKTDEYFVTQGEKILTSDHTLEKLKNKQLDGTELQELLKNQRHVSKVHQEGIAALNQNHKSLFPMWHTILEEGFSLLLYGLGSKRTLINDFHREITFDHPTLIVNGFFPSLTIKDILDSIITDLLELQCPSNINDCFTCIKDIMNDNPDDRLYLLIHNLDGPQLRSHKAQDTLSRLAAIKNIHLVASVDHINAPLIWDNLKRARYNFYWCDATTLLPYEAETAYETSLFVQQSGALALSSLNNVFASLTSNAKAIYTILVNYQLENGKSNVYPGMAFRDLYRKAREGFFVSSDIGLRAQLTEFLDHKLVRTKRNIDGAEYLDIPIDNLLLQKFLDKQQQS